MAPKGDKYLAGGFHSSPTPLYYKAAVLVPFGTQAVLPKKDHKCFQGWLGSRCGLEGLSQPAMAHGLCHRFSLRHALGFVAVGIVTFVFL